MALPTLVVGAHLRVYVNGQPFGRTRSGRFKSSTPRRRVKVIDSFVPAESVQLGAEGSGSISVYKIHADGGAQAAGIVAAFADLSLEKYFSILILDRFSDTVVFRADRCSLEEEDWDLPTRGFVTGTFNFTAIDWNNEGQTKLTSAG